MIRTFGRFAIGTTFLFTAASSATNAQVVQLPTFHSFGVSTTVSVPDRGGLSLGGTTTGRSSRAVRGFPPRRLPFANPLFGNDLRNGAGAVSRAGVTATVIDLHEWDSAVLAEARGRPEQAGVATDAANRRHAEHISRHVATSSGGARPHRARGQAKRRKLTSRDAIPSREQDESHGELSQLNYDQLMSRGREAMAAGRYRLAKKYFQAAAGE